MNKNIIIAIIVGILIIFAAVQAIQLSGVGSSTGSTVKVTENQQQQSSPAPRSAPAPSGGMVGGC